MSSVNPATPNVTVTSPFWNNVYTPISGRSPLRGQLRRLMRKRSMQVDGELSKELNGVVAGANASVTYKRVAHPSTTPVGVGALGGLITMETVTQIGRVTATADTTQLNNIMQPTKLAPTSYPVDASGNGK